MRETIKFNLWAKYFSDKTDRLCYGNATQSAIKAYGYDPVSQYNLASVTGSKNIRKHKILGICIAEELGFGYRDFIKLGIKKVIEGSYQDWEDFMVLIGYHKSTDLNRHNRPKQ